MKVFFQGQIPRNTMFNTSGGIDWQPACAMIHVAANPCHTTCEPRTFKQGAAAENKNGMIVIVLVGGMQVFALSSAPDVIALHVGSHSRKLARWVSTHEN